MISTNLSDLAVLRTRSLSKVRGISRSRSSAPIAPADAMIAWFSANVRSIDRTDALPQ
jgi:hypothetical protein